MSTPFDVLVLGAGLSGLRAAIAALEQAPGLRVGVVSPHFGPSGSSFCNRNGFLGMQAPTPEQEEPFMARVLEIAAPGFVDPELVRILATEARERLRELLDWGARVRGERSFPDHVFPNHVSPGRVAGCFFPHVRSGVILEDLPGLRSLLTRRITDLGGVLLPGTTVIDIVRNAERVCGAVIAGAGGQSEFLSASAVVAALGGPAPLFAHSLAGEGNPGVSYALLERAGAQLENAGFVQFSWQDAQNLEFVPLQLAARDVWQAWDAERGEWHAPESGALALAPERATHVPYAHCQPDAAIDRFYLDHRQTDGTVLVLPPDGSARRIAPFAQAGNGGARLDSGGDSVGQTTAPGLFACGECATGMHGANRVGGGMVAAALVFGRRAGAAAARLAGGGGAPVMAPEGPVGRVSRPVVPDAPKIAQGDAPDDVLGDVALELSHHAGCGGTDVRSLAQLVEFIQNRLGKEPHGRALQLHSALVMVRALLAIRRSVP